MPKDFYLKRLRVNSFCLLSLVYDQRINAMLTVDFVIFSLLAK